MPWAGSIAFRGLIAPLLGHQAQRLLPEVQDLTSVFARVDAAGPVIARLAQGWRTEDQRLCELLAEQQGPEPRQGQPLSPGLPGTSPGPGGCLVRRLGGDPGVHAPARGLRGPDRPVPDRATPRRRPDPSLADPYFAACGALWDLLLTLKRDLKVAALVDAAAFARDRSPRGQGARPGPELRRPPHPAPRRPASRRQSRCGGGPGRGPGQVHPGALPGGHDRRVPGHRPRPVRHLPTPVPGPARR